MWSEGEERELRRLFEAGESYRQIARAMGHSVEAVASKLHRLGLSRAPGGAAWRRTMAVRAGKVTLPPLASLDDSDAR